MKKTTFKLHPIAILYMLRAYWYVLTAPYVRAVWQYVVLERSFHIYWSERTILLITCMFVVLNWQSTNIVVTNTKITIKAGVLTKTIEKINISQISAIVTEQNVISMLSGAVACNVYLKEGTRARTIIMRRREANALCAVAFGGFCDNGINILRKKSRYFTTPTIIFVVTAMFGVFLIKIARTACLICWIVGLAGMFGAVYNYRNEKCCFSNIFFAQRLKFLKLYRIYCNNGECTVRMTRSLIDRKNCTCRLKFLLCNAAPKSVIVRNVELIEAKRRLDEKFLL